MEGTSGAADPGAPSRGHGGSGPGWRLRASAAVRRVRDGGLGSPGPPRDRRLRPAPQRSRDTRCPSRRDRGDELSPRAIMARGAESGSPDGAPGSVRIGWLRRGGATARATLLLGRAGDRRPPKGRGHPPWRRGVHGAPRPEPVRWLGRCSGRRLSWWWAGSGRSRGRARGSHLDCRSRRAASVHGGRGQSARGVRGGPGRARESGPVKGRRKPSRRVERRGRWRAPALREQAPGHSSREGAPTGEAVRVDARSADAVSAP